MVDGILGGVIAVIALGVASMLVCRRCRRQGDDAGEVERERREPMARKADVVEVMRATGSGKWFWHLMSANGEILAHSEEYDSKRNCMDTARGIVARNPTLKLRVTP